MKSFIAILFLFVMTTGTAGGWLQSATNDIICLADTEESEGKGGEEKKEVKELIPHPATALHVAPATNKWHMPSHIIYPSPSLVNPTPPPDPAC